MCSNAVKGLKADIKRENFIEHAHGMDIMAEMPAAGFKKKLIEISFACVTERCMADIVTEGYSFDKLEIETECLTYCTGNA